MSYIVAKYAADGHEGGPEDGYVVGQYQTLSEARAEIRRLLGVRALRNGRKWSGVGCIEAYHDFPPTHPRAYGCGGYAIEAEK